MTLLDRLEKRLGQWAVPHLMLLLIGGQVIAYIMTLQQPELAEKLSLVPMRVQQQGEVWRLFSFLFLPPATNLVLAFFFWYMLFLMGQTLESVWGVFRFNLFLLIGWLATLAAAWITPQLPAENRFLQLSIFLAFAYLYPNFQLMLFFLLPVRIYWLALLSWLGILATLVWGDWPMRWAALASVANFLLFFGRDLIGKAAWGRRWMTWQTKQYAEKGSPFHRCVVCGITDKTNPEMTFRYCSKCQGAQGYCEAHIRNHEHITAHSMSDG